MYRLIALAVLGALACSDGARSGGGHSNAGPEDCAALAPKIEKLYRAEMAAPLEAEDPEARAKEEQVLGDNVEMVLIDCRAEPGRFVPCIESAAGVAQLERDCLIPLDDEGTVEGKALSSE